MKEIEVGAKLEYPSVQASTDNKITNDIIDNVEKDDD